MKRFKKITIRTLIVLAILIPVTAFAHFLVFPEETKCILIDYSSFKKEGRLYFNSDTKQTDIDTIKILMQQASVRIENFWGQKTANPKFIYCNTEADFKKFGSPAAVPAVTHTKLGAYIVLSNDAVDPDIIAHEMMHAELYDRIGFYAWSFKLPMWFKQGLAMQCDLRNYYSEDTLIVRSENFKHMPDVKNFSSDAQFYEGTPDQVMLNYMTAKHEIKNWYTKEKLNKLIADLNNGKAFKEAFGK